MAYNVRYSGEFFDADGTVCRIDICQDGYSGVINNIVFGNDPVIIKMDSANQPIYQSIKTTSIEINLLKTYFTQYDEFQNNDDKEYIVRLYVNNIIRFSGWLITSGITEPYRSVPYILSFQCVDGINRLKDIDFTTPTSIYTKEFSGDYYYRAWRVSIAEIMAEVMANMTPDYTIRSYCNLFADNDGTGFNILAGKNYINYELVKGSSVYDALEKIVKGIGHKLVIDGTIIKIYSLKELEQWAYGEHVSYTDYDNDFNIITSGTELVETKQINVDFKLKTGATKTKNPAYKQFVLTVDYGRLDNVLIPGIIENSVTIDDNNNATVHFFKKSSNLVKVMAKEMTDKKFALDVSYSSGNYNFNDNFLKLHFKLKDVPPLYGTRGRLRFSIDFKLGDTKYDDLDHYYTIVNNPDFIGFIYPYDGYISHFALYKFEYDDAWGWCYLNPPTPGHYQSFPNATDKWQTIEFDLVHSLPLKNNDLTFVITPADHQSSNKSYPFQFKNISLTFYNTDDDGNRLLYPSGEKLTVVNNVNGLFNNDEIKIELASMPDEIYGEKAYNLMHIYKSCIIIETNAPNFFEVKNIYHSSNPANLQQLQDYIGRLIASTASISQSVINCDLLGELNSWLNPIINTEEPNSLYIIGSGSYNFKRKEGKYELLQYVPYVGDEWDRILTEDGSIVLAENSDEFLTEKNFI